MSQFLEFYGKIQIISHANVLKKQIISAKSDFSYATVFVLHIWAIYKFFFLKVKKTTQFISARARQLLQCKSDQKPLSLLATLPYFMQFSYFQGKSFKFKVWPYLEQL